MARMDEFDWLTEINRASIVTNLRSGLINHSTAVMAADALRGGSCPMWKAESLPARSA